MISLFTEIKSIQDYPDNKNPLSHLTECEQLRQWERELQVGRWQLIVGAVWGRALSGACSSSWGWKDVMGSPCLRGPYSLDCKTMVCTLKDKQSHLSQAQDTQ